MANVFATKTGNWSDPTVWNTGALPEPTDDVYSNNFTVTIDISPTILSIRNTSGAGINAGGGFQVVTTGLTITCIGTGVIVGQGTCLTFNVSSPGICVLNANCFGSTESGSGTGVNNSNTGTLTITGSITGGLSNVSAGVRNSDSGVINIIGNCTTATTSGSGSSSPGVLNSTSGRVNITGNVSSRNFYPGLINSGVVVIEGNVFAGPGNGIQNSGDGTITVTGEVVAGSANNTSGISNSGTLNIFGTVKGSSAGVVTNGVSNSGILNVTGDVIGGQAGGGSNVGITNTGSGVTTITGTVIGGTGTGAGFVNNSGGIINHIGSAFASASAPAIGVGSASQRTVLTGPLVSTEGTGVLAAASGVNPCQALRWFPMDTALGTFTYIMRGATLSGDPSSRPERILALPEGYEAGYPDPSDVRLPVPYGPAGLYTGTCAVPAPTSVLTGVPVDDTVGSFAASASDLWNAPIELVGSPGSIAERMKNAATVQSVGAQIEALGT
jgi:hypothetical protein